MYNAVCGVNRECGLLNHFARNKANMLPLNQVEMLI